ncbi:MAG: hypothetical protein NVS3B9_1160 [Candidatus Doudnabacteria bacterium]
MHGDPKVTAHLTPSQIDCQDRQAVTKSVLIICYVGMPSTGVGIELEMAHHSNTHAILIYEENSAVSRLVLGSPAAKNIISFKDDDELFYRLRAALQEFHQRFETLNLPDPLRLTKRK